MATKHVPILADIASKVIIKWNRGRCGNLIKPTSRIRIPDTMVTRSVNGTNVSKVIKNISMVSFPAALYSYCETRKKHIAVPSFSLPAHISCPGAIDNESSYQVILRASIKRNANKLDISESNDHISRFVCSVCYASKGTFRFGDVVCAHMARYNDVLEACKSYVESRDSIDETSLIESIYNDILNGTHGTPLSSYYNANNAIRWISDLTYAFYVSLNETVLSCKCCTKRIRMHMSGDLFSPAYCHMLRIVFAVLFKLVPDLMVWFPTRNTHDGIGARLWNATLELANSHPNITIVGSGLQIDVPLESDPIYKLGLDSLSMVASTADIAVEHGYTPCHKQTESPTHTCDHCVACYMRGNRQAFIEH